MDLRVLLTIIAFCLREIRGNGMSFGMLSGASSSSMSQSSLLSSSSSNFGASRYLRRGGIQCSQCIHHVQPASLLAETVEVDGNQDLPLNQQGFGAIGSVGGGQFSGAAASAYSSSGEGDLFANTRSGGAGFMSSAGLLSSNGFIPIQKPFLNMDMGLQIQEAVNRLLANLGIQMQQGVTNFRPGQTYIIGNVAANPAVQVQQTGQQLQQIQSQGGSFQAQGQGIGQASSGSMVAQSGPETNGQTRLIVSAPQPVVITYKIVSGPQSPATGLAFNLQNVDQQTGSAYSALQNQQQASSVVSASVANEGLAVGVPVAKSVPVQTAVLSQSRSSSGFYDNTEEEEEDQSSDYVAPTTTTRRRRTRTTTTTTPSTTTESTTTAASRAAYGDAEEEVVDAPAKTKIRIVSSQKKTVDSSSNYAYEKINY